MPRKTKATALDLRPARIAFETTVPMPKPGYRGCRVPARAVHISIYPDLPALNHQLWAKRLFPRGRPVNGLASCHRRGPVAAYLHFSLDLLLPGLVAHECAHAALFIARNDLGWKSVYGRAWRRRSGPKRGFRLGSEKEEWFCRALAHLVTQVLEGAGNALSAEPRPSDREGGMKDCDTCGNELPDLAATCRFCGAQQAASARPLPREKVRTACIKDGLPTVDQGLARLQADLAAARPGGARVLRVIHGYGSSGKGGALKDACRAFLARELRAGRIRAFVPGESYSRATVAGRDLMGKWPELKAAERTDSGNPGITLVEL